MYPSLSQIVTSLDRLSGVHPFFGYAFFGFKKAGIPIGTTADFRYSTIGEEILQQYYSFDGIKGYYNPFKSIKSWVSDRYDSTSLQRIITDTFGSAFIRNRGTREWGWSNDYVLELEALRIAVKSDKIPLLDIAVWLYRKTSFDYGNKAEAPKYLIERLKKDFFLTEDELHYLFDGEDLYRSIDFTTLPIDDRELLNIIGFPDDYNLNYPISINRLSIRNVGPFSRIQYKPSQRLNVIAGDNSLGKTFLLELLWWSLTGIWTNYPADPQNMQDRSEIEMDFEMSASKNQNVLAPYNRVESEWQRPAFELHTPVIYFSFDGSVHVSGPSATSDHLNSDRLVKLNREQLWRGHSMQDRFGRMRAVSNGLLQDLTLWQLLPDRYPGRLAVFEKALRALSPPEGRPLKLGMPARLKGDIREIPTIRMPYGNVPFIYLSAGIQKSVSIAYVFVWAYFEFLKLDSNKSDNNSNRIIIILDEIEAHLHPKWQRQIVPALLAALEEIIPSASFQIHIATHSPLVMASLETEFDSLNDRIHVINFTGADVSMSSQPFIKHGSVNSWLESDIFGLGTARSKPAEEAISLAKKLLAKQNIDQVELERVNRTLADTLPEDDPFWVRWNRFFEFKLGRSSNVTSR